MYAKITSDNKLKYAQHYIIKDNALILNPQEQNYLDAGYKPVVNIPISNLDANQEYSQVITEEEDKIIITYLPVENNNQANDELN